jgi:hypothetical protein
VQLIVAPIFYRKEKTMQRKLINSQLSNFKTYEMYRRQFMTLAENVFEFKNMPEFIDTAYLNKNLLRKGSIAFFKDEIMGVLALPYINMSRLDVYGRPNKIQVIAQNGYTKALNRNEFVIMYDNNGRYPLWLDILQYSERMALATRVIDINMSQQKTPRFWKTKTNKKKSVEDIVNNVDGFENVVLTYDDVDLNDTTLILEPAPYVADKVNLDKDRIYNEFLRLIGIANLSFQKQERNIRDEIQAMQGGTIASRYSRFEPRKKAIDEINKKFGTNIEVKYYDGIPTTEEEFEQKLSDNEEVEEDVNI